MTTCTECGFDPAIREHRIGCSLRPSRDSYRAGRSVEDPRFRDGKYIGPATAPWEINPNWRAPEMLPILNRENHHD